MINTLLNWSPGCGAWRFCRERSARGPALVVGLLTALLGWAQVATLPAPSDKSEGVSAHPILTWSSSETNLLSNGGFEEGLDGWDVGTAMRVDSGDYSPAEGTHLLRGVGGRVQRELVLPEGYGGLRLTYRVRGTFVVPNLLLEFLDDPRSPLQLSSVRQRANGWSTYGADLTPFAGRSVRLTWQFNAIDNLPWLLDDVRLMPVSAGTEFEVWFSTNLVSQLTSLGRTTSPAWPLRFLPPGRRFYWRVDIRHNGQTNQGPVWQFQTSQFLNVTQLLVDPLPELLCAQQPVMLGLQVADENGFPGPNPSSIRTVRPVVEAASEDRPPPPVVITELNLATETIEFQNLTAQTLDLSGWLVDVLQGGLATNAVRIPVPAGSTLTSGARFEVQMRRSTGGAWPRLTSQASVSWSTFRRAGVVLRDSSGAVSDCVFYDQAGRAPSTADPRPGQTRAVGIGHWRGGAVTNAIPSGWTLQRAGNRDLNWASDWVFAPASPFALNANLVTPFGSGYGPVPVVIPTGEVVTDRNGYFTLPVQVSGPISNVVLYATAYLAASDRTGVNGRTLPLTLKDEICLTVELPHFVNETVGTLPNGLRLRIPAPRDTNVVVRLRSPTAREEDVTVPAELIIPAGATDVAAELVVSDNTDLTGPRTLVVFADAPGYAPAQTSSVIEDDESAVLRLELGSEVGESGQLIGKVLVDRPAIRPVTIRLHSSDPDRLRVVSSVNGAAAVTLEAGSTEVPITVVARDNPDLEGPIRVVVRAEFANWTPAENAVAITDNETNALRIFRADTEPLAEGQPATDLTIALGGLVTQAVPLTISFDPPGRLSPAPELAIPAGASSVVLPLQPVDDELKNGRVEVTVRVTAPGWQDGVFTVPLFDNEPARFRVQMPPGPLQIQREFQMTAMPESIDGFSLPRVWLPDVQVTAREEGGLLVSGLVGPTFANESGMNLPITLTQGSGMMRFRVEANSAVGKVIGESVPVPVWNVPPPESLTALASDEARGRLLVLNGEQPLRAIELRNGSEHSLSPALPAVAQAVVSGPQTAFVSWLGNRELARIHPATLEVLATWPVGTTLSGSPQFLRHFLPLPGQSDSLVVGRDGTPGTELAVFDGTNARPIVSRLDSGQPLSLLPGLDPGQIFAVTPDRLEEFAVTAQGLQRVEKPWSLQLLHDRMARPGDSVISQGQVLSGQGELLDPALPGRLGGNAPDFRPNSFATDPHTGRLAWYQGDPNGTVVFRLFDPLTLQEVWRRVRQAIPAAFPGALVAAGPHQWAVLVNGRLQLETDEAPDPAPATDLAVSVVAVTRHPAASVAAVRWRIENRGSNSAPEVRLMFGFPESRERGPAAMVVTAISTNATLGTNGLGGTSYALGDLSPGAAVEVTADLRAAFSGQLHAAAWVGSAAADPDPKNNRATVTADGLGPQLALGIHGPEAEGGLRLEFPTALEWIYFVEGGTSPEGPWESIGGYQGTGQPMSLTLPADSGPTRFWRLSVVSP